MHAMCIAIMCMNMPVMWVAPNVVQQFMAPGGMVWHVLLVSLCWVEIYYIRNLGSDSAPAAMTLQLHYLEP